MHTTRKLVHWAEHQWVWLRRVVSAPWSRGWREESVACSLAWWHAGILYPDTSSSPAPAQLQHGAVRRKWNVAARLLGSPGPRQPPTRLLLFYARLGPAQPRHSQAADSFPSPCWRWCRPGAGLPHQCVISPLSLHPARHGAMGLYSNIYTYTHTLLFKDSIRITFIWQCQSSIWYSIPLHWTVFRYLDPGYGI